MGAHKRTVIITGSPRPVKCTVTCYSHPTTATNITYYPPTVSSSWSPPVTLIIIATPQPKSLHPLPTGCLKTSLTMETCISASWSHGRQLDIRTQSVTTVSRMPYRSQWGVLAFTHNLHHIRQRQKTSFRARCPTPSWKTGFCARWPRPWRNTGFGAFLPIILHNSPHSVLGWGHVRPWHNWSQ